MRHFFMESEVKQYQFVTRSLGFLPLCGSSSFDWLIRFSWSFATGYGARLFLIYDKHLKTTRKYVKISFSLLIWEARWPHSYCTRLWSEWSGFEPWLGTLS